MALLTLIYICSLTLFCFVCLFFSPHAVQSRLNESERKEQVGAQVDEVRIARFLEQHPLKDHSVLQQLDRAAVVSSSPEALATRMFFSAADIFLLRIVETVFLCC